jgi:hypothetical protein
MSCFRVHYSSTNGRLRSSFCCLAADREGFWLSNSLCHNGIQQSHVLESYWTAAVLVDVIDRRGIVIVLFK